jgi:hypothetical protein
MVGVLAFTSFEFSKNAVFSFKRKVPRLSFVFSIYQLRLSDPGPHRVFPVLVYKGLVIEPRVQEAP